MYRLMMLVLSLTLLFSGHSYEREIFAEAVAKTEEKPGVFSFIVIADPHVGWEGYWTLEDFNIVIKQINDLSEKPDFVWIVGDIGGISESAYSDFDMPVHVVFGNWESIKKERKRLCKIFPELKKDYYSFRHKGSLFIGLCNAIYEDDVGHLQSGYIYPGQIRWFEQELADNYQEASHIFVFAHIPIGRAENLEGGAYLAENDRKYVVSLIDKYKPSAFFFGHLHKKEEFKIGRTQIITIPSCNYACSTPPCFLRVKVFPDKIETEYILVSETERLKIREKVTGACLPLDLRKQTNMGFKDEKANDQKGGLFDEGRSLKGLPAGSNTFAGIVFDVIDPEKNNGLACIVLRGQAKPYFPEKAEGILVGRKAKNVYLLHGASYCARDSHEVVYRLKFNYADGTEAYADIKADSEITDWCNQSGDQLASARPAWVGKAIEKTGNAGEEKEWNVCLYCARIANPNPEKEIRTMDIISTNNAAVPGIFAVTVTEN